VLLPHMSLARKRKAALYLTESRCPSKDYSVQYHVAVEFPSMLSVR